LSASTNFTRLFRPATFQERSLKGAEPATGVARGEAIRKERRGGGGELGEVWWW
jgi:hypothetical protein